MRENVDARPPNDAWRQAARTRSGWRGARDPATAAERRVAVEAR